MAGIEISIFDLPLEMQEFMLTQADSCTCQRSKDPLFILLELEELAEQHGMDVHSFINLYLSDYQSNHKRKLT